MPWASSKWEVPGDAWHLMEAQDSQATSYSFTPLPRSETRVSQAERRPQDAARRIATPLGKPLNYNYRAAETAVLCSLAFEVVIKRAQCLFSLASQLLMLFCPPKWLIHPHEDGFNSSEEKESGETLTNSAGQILNMLQEMPPPTAHPDQTPPSIAPHRPPSRPQPHEAQPRSTCTLELPKSQLQTSAFPMNILCSLLNKWFQDRASYYS